MLALCQYFLCFAIFSFIGWAWESVYYTIQQGEWVNSGFLSTCFCPIYGLGSLIALWALGRIENSFLLFFAAMIIMTVFEYIISWGLEKLFHQRWWDYTNWPLNINGRVCIISGMAFGIMVVLLIKIIAPFTLGVLGSISPLTVEISALIIAAIMLADTIVTIVYMDTSKLWYVDKQSEIFEKISESRFANIVKKAKAEDTNKNE